MHVRLGSFCPRMRICILCFTFGEPKTQHSESMKNRVIPLTDTIVDELYEYKNLGVLKNCVGSFSSNVKDNIEENQQKSWLDSCFLS